MNLKEFVTGKEGITFVKIYASGVPSNYLSCNVYRNFDGSYYFQEPNIELNELSAINMQDVTKHEWHNDGIHHGIYVTINEDAIRRNQSLIIYRRLKNLLDKY